MNNTLKFIFTLLIIIFGIEVAIHFILTLLPDLGHFASVLLDAGLLVVIIAPIVYWQLKREQKKVDKANKDNTTNIEKLKHALSEVLQLKQALDEAAIVAITDKKGVIISANDKFCAISKYSREELIGKDHNVIRSDYHSHEFFKNMWKTIGSGKVWKGEIMNKDKNGDSYWVNTTIVPFLDEKNKPYQYVAIRYDISENKKILLELQKLSAFQNAMLNGTSYAIVSTNTEGIIVSFNKGAEDLLGYNAAELINIASPAIFHEVDEVVAKAKELTHELGYLVQPGFEVFVLKSRTVVADVNEWTYIKKDGTKITVTLSITTLRNSLNEIIGYLGIANDITQEKKAQLELLHAKEQAVAASIAKSDFLANMSHEIRTPLNGVIGFTDLLMKTKLTESQEQYMSIVYQSATSLLDIINDILDFSKIEAGKLELEIEKTDLIQLTSQIADLVAYQVNQKDLELLLSISRDIPRFVWTDAVRLRQILINLLGNAAKFTHKGEIELKIEMIKKGPEETTFRFSVRDTGVGIDTKNISKIFKAFEQADNSTTRKFGGTGLGLSITSKILELMNGSTLQVNSTPGVGSIFYFDVSFKAEEGEPLDQHDISSIKRVLVVDDNANNRLILNEMLAGSNIIAEHASDGAQALDKLKSESKFDVVLMDFHMPGMDGIETIREIRKMPGMSALDQTIILLSSSSDYENIVKACKELGVQQRLTKPIKIQQLYDALAKSIMMKGLAGEAAEINAGAGLVKNNRKLKVLIADDNPINLYLAEAIISNVLPNATIVQAENGLEALILFKEEIPDIVFMDIQMPEMNGYEAATAIRNLSNGEDVPIIALTAGTVTGERERCIAAGMNEYISKPFVQESIETVILQYLSV